MVNQKCERWAAALVETLGQRLGALYAGTKAYDPNPDVYVKVALVAGGNNSVKAIIKLVQAAAPASGAVDSLGLTQTVYTPHIAQVIHDINASGTTTTERFCVELEMAKLGTRIELYEKDAGAGNVAVADIASGQFVVAYDHDIWFGALTNV